MKYDAIFIVGPQGSGKGTQAKVLVERLGFFHWNMGEVLRADPSWRFKDGRTVADIIDKGGLLTDDLLLEVFEAKIGTLPKGQGIIFDGIPRRIGQAQFLLKFLRDQGKKNFVTIFLDIPRDESIHRLVLRGELEHRADDTPEAIDFRLKQYQEATVPMLDYLRTETIFVDIDGIPAVPNVAKSISDALQLDEYDLYVKS